MNELTTIEPTHIRSPKSNTPEKRTSPPKSYISWNTDKMLRHEGKKVEVSFLFSRISKQ